MAAVILFSSNLLVSVCSIPQNCDTYSYIEVTLKSVLGYAEPENIL